MSQSEFEAISLVVKVNYIAKQSKIKVNENFSRLIVVAKKV